MRKFVLLLVLILALGASVTQAQDDFSDLATTWRCPEGFAGQTLNLYNWTTYVAEDTIPNFERLCGVTLVQTFYGSNEEMIAKLRTGNPGYDVVVPTGGSVVTMLNAELLEPIDLSMVPNAANVTPSLLDPVYDPGNQYTLPYQWGTMGVGYNIEAVGGEITSWQQVWDFQGNVAWLEDLDAMLGIGLDLLGYDPNSMNPDEVTEARDYLLDRAANVRAIAQDDGQEKLQTGEVDIVIEYSGDIFQIIADCEANPEKNCAGQFAFALPEEGAIRWVDNLAIPVGAPNPALAHVFFDYILDPQVGADISNYTAFSSPNQTSIDEGLILPEYLDSPIIYPTAESAEHLFSIVNQGDEWSRMRIDVWDELKVLLAI
jgi:spermidine/putrescine transport system substrate-binding protein